MSLCSTETVAYGHRWYCWNAHAQTEFFPGRRVFDYMHSSIIICQNRKIKPLLRNVDISLFIPSIVSLITAPCFVEYTIIGRKSHDDDVWCARWSFAPLWYRFWTIPTYTNSTGTRAEQFLLARVWLKISDRRQNSCARSEQRANNWSCW